MSADRPAEKKFDLVLVPLVAAAMLASCGQQAQPPDRFCVDQRNIRVPDQQCVQPAQGSGRSGSSGSSGSWGGSGASGGSGGSGGMLFYQWYYWNSMVGGQRTNVGYGQVVPHGGSFVAPAASAGAPIGAPSAGVTRGGFGSSGAASSAGE